MLNDTAVSQESSPDQDQISREEEGSPQGRKRTAWISLAYISKIPIMMGTHLMRFEFFWMSTVVLIRALVVNFLEFGTNHIIIAFPIALLLVIKDEKSYIGLKFKAWPSMLNLHGFDGCSLTINHVKPWYDQFNLKSICTRFIKHKSNT